MIISIIVFVGLMVVLFAPFIGLAIYSYVEDRRDEQRDQEERAIRWALEERRPPEEVAQVIAGYERRYKRRVVIVSPGTSASGAIIRCEQR